jgi:hypothetical protein
VVRVQACLQRVFAEYGLPGVLRVDNGAPWGSWSDLPTALALWLIGLGIDMHWNTPRRPQENGVIERSQGLAGAWAEPQQCQTVKQFQLRLRREDRLQREVYPSVRNQSRLTAYPTLHHSGRHYSPRWEQQHWNWPRVLAHLSTYCVPRRVDQSGKIGLFTKNSFSASCTLVVTCCCNSIQNALNGWPAINKELNCASSPPPAGLLKLSAASKSLNHPQPRNEHFLVNS